MAASRYGVKSKTHMLKNDNLPSILEPAVPAPHIAGTKVTVTLGPACRDVETLVQMLEAGMACARVDLTWGPVEYHMQSLKNLQEAVKRSRRLCAVMVDTLGREMTIRRTYNLNEQGWPVHEEPIPIKKGQILAVTTDVSATASSERLPITYPGFAAMCTPGDTLFIGRYLVNGADQSSLYLEIKEVKGEEVMCEAMNDAELDGLLTVIHSERSDDGMSNRQTDLPMLAQHDVMALKQLSAAYELDFVALTYTCDGGDVQEMREFLDDIGLVQAKIIAKVENRQALNNFSSIATMADGVILSRGNLGLDVAPEKMALVQKCAISRCNLLGKPVIITRVVDTMVSVPRCTRAEATDVANAVLDGVDGVLLGAETLRGKYPVATVKTVLSICRQAEEVFDHSYHFDFLMSEALDEAGYDDASQHSGSQTGGSPAGGNSPNGSTQNLAQLSAASEAPFSPTSISSPRNLNLSLPPLPRTGSGSQARLQELRSPGSHKLQSSGMTRVSSFGSIPRTASVQSVRAVNAMHVSPGGTPWLSKVESIASTAVRAADKIKASLIIVYASTGRTASLVAKYRPNMPILALVIPTLKSSSLSWELHGRSLARQCLIMRGVIPMLAAPMPGDSDRLLSDAVASAAQRGLVQAHDHIVCVMSMKDDLILKIVSMDSLGEGMKTTKTGSSQDLAALGTPGKKVLATA
ncbi:hypothetical protein WJX72_005997 [[Myrmecia] bisecta]|uniref:Pyruvate kinase n=1 Tax=[Myrmecia] bisecta TaxID=41462 RepID=A0AAW1PTW0_9CHLO